MNEMNLIGPEKLNVTDEPATKSYLQQLQAMEVESLEHPVVSSVLQLNAAKLFRLGDKMESLIATEWGAGAPTEAFQRTRPVIEAFLKATRQAERLVRLSHELQQDDQ